MTSFLRTLIFDILLTVNRSWSIASYCGYFYFYCCCFIFSCFIRKCICLIVVTESILSCAEFIGYIKFYKLIHLTSIIFIWNTKFKTMKFIVEFLALIFIITFILEIIKTFHFFLLKIFITIYFFKLCNLNFNIFVFIFVSILLKPSITNIKVGIGRIPCIYIGTKPWWDTHIIKEIIIKITIFIVNVTTIVLFITIWIIRTIFFFICLSTVLC